MKIIKTKKELNALIVNDVLAVDDDLKITFNTDVRANIKCNKLIACNICAHNISAHDIDAHNINARNINAYDIYACNIYARNIYSHNIHACNIYARNINADDIRARNIDADDISYCAVCFAYKDIICKKITGRGEDAKHICLHGGAAINGDKNEN